MSPSFIDTKGRGEGGRGAGEDQRDSIGNSGCKKHNWFEGRKTEKETTGIRLSTADHSNLRSENLQNYMMIV